MSLQREAVPDELPDGSKKKSALPWVIGCLIALVVVPAVIGFLGVVAAIAIPAFVQARNRAQLESCLTNLQDINRAKTLAATQNAHTNGTPVTMADLSEFLLRDGTPTCPQGGTYTVNAIGRDASCSAHTTSFSPGSACCPSPAPAPEPDAAPAPLENSP